MELIVLGDKSSVPNNVYWVHQGSAKYPFRIHQVSEDDRADTVIAGTHLMLGRSSGSDINGWNASLQRLRDQAYILEPMGEYIYRVSWKNPGLHAFYKHKDHISRLAPDAILEQDNLLQTLSVPASDQRYRFDNDLDLDWMYDQGIRADGIVVALIDTGVQLDHPNLSAAIWANPMEQLNGQDSDQNGYVDDLRGWDFVDNDNDPSDEDGHGTALAGILSGTHENNPGNAGIALGSRILCIRTLDTEGGWTSDAIKGINYARLQGADIINASWGRASEEDTQLLQIAIEEYIGQGGLFVAASGNEGLNLDENEYSPAGLDIPEMVVVGGHQKNRAVTGSNYGLETVDLLAPYHVDGIQLGEEGTQYIEGSSISAPIVSAALAIGLVQFPELSGSELVQRLCETGRLIPSAVLYIKHPGIINFKKFIEGEIDAEPDQLAYSLAPETFYTGETIRIQFEGLPANPEFHTVAFSFERANGEQGIFIWDDFTALELDGIDEQESISITVHTASSRRVLEPIILDPLVSKPIALQNLPAVIELTEMNEPIRELIGDFQGSRPMSTQWYKNGVRISRAILSPDIGSAGTYELVASNPFGEVRQTVSVQFDGFESRENAWAQSYYYLPGEGGIFFRSSNGLKKLTFDGIEQVTENWIPEPIQWIFEFGSLMFIKQGHYEPFTYLGSNDGTSWIELSFPESTVQPKGILAGQVVFLGNEAIYFVDPESWEIRSEDAGRTLYPIAAALFDNTGMYLVSGYRLLRYTMDEGWTDLGYVPFNVGRNAARYNGSMFFFEKPANYAVTHDGITVEGNTATGPAGLNLYNADMQTTGDGVMLEYEDIVYRFEPGSSSWEAVYNFRKPKEFLVPDSALFVGEKNFIFDGMAGPYKLSRGITDAIATPWGFYLSDHFGTYFTASPGGQLQFVSGSESRFCQTPWGTFRLEKEGFYRLRPDLQEREIGDGYSNSDANWGLMGQTRLYFMDGLFVLRGESTNFVFNPDLKVWVTSLDQDGKFFNGELYKGPESQELKSLADQSTSPLLQSYHGMLYYPVNDPNSWVSLDFLFHPMFPDRSIHKDLFTVFPGLLSLGGNHIHHDPSWGTVIYEGHWDRFIYSEDSGWMKAVESSSDLGLAYSFLHGWIGVDPAALPYVFSFENQNWMEVTGAQIN